jgi:hypothetical protein
MIIANVGSARNTVKEGEEKFPTIGLCWIYQRSNEWKFTCRVFGLDV